MKEFVKALNTEENRYQYIFLAFPGPSYEKVKTEVFDIPQIRQLIKDQNFITSYDSCRGKEHGKPKTFWAMTRLKNTKMWLKQHFKVIIILGRTLSKLNQLVKRNKRFDFIMLVWVQGSLFHIPVHKA